MIAALLSLSGLLLAAVVWIILFLILGVTLWVAFVAAGGTLVVWAFVGGLGIAPARRRAH
jgi:predicted membrane metal-binding protein